MKTHVTVNGEGYERDVEPRMLLSDFLRHELGLTGTNVGCEHGVCGSCTVLLDGEPVRSCTMLAVQSDRRRLTTVEGLACEENLHGLQEAFTACHGLQCGFCTPGMLMTLLPIYNEARRLTDDEIRDAISGNLCRCTGYQQIVESARKALDEAADLAEFGADAEG
ncbi:carbon-monoxide dehydrogenase small subunit/6-hydroxypseudooxynicotine dehydrogenase subunit beta [Nocardioides alpinus]|jgi:aerobic-type carbon monoxide dehydrogenase small subunit (CoxS/CutS family)|uniref:(2Fe-2S)-binding protein n=2 Tax=Nocardioides TaxID=1839 RepID=A0A4Q2SMT3_9ACTN|nr:MULTISPECIES: (2Fe-2S)-binding protein [Nocardioides]PKH38497.1 (2Fe-2S)-binding protein [Nocardioides alpinus]RYC05358.1 (2Fe-2S)-binding protein [Nocardioides zhouii]SFB47717.1 carbon-monoxide dehydrogenase small subunit/6-hydroxypseudooxynicotine dehydrogenase subunit beta [Nocardioides alpinus]